MKKIAPSKLIGEITVQGSKSMSHRSIICAALSKNKSEIKNLNYCTDIYATLNALKAMGLCEYEITEKSCIVTGGLHNTSEEYVNCEESGSTIRFLLPLAKEGTKFTGKGRLLSRPMDIFKALGLDYTHTAEYLQVTKQINGGNYNIRGDVSSQFISGLLFALPLKENNSTINITSKVESRDYIELTRQMQELFCVKSSFTENQIYIEGNQQYKNTDVFVEGDYSHAAFFAVAAAIGGDITIKGLKQDSLQGDKEVFNIIEKMGGNVHYGSEGIRVVKSELRGIDIDASQIPDLVPVLAVLACACDGVVKIYNAGRLRIKESDRLNAVTTELNKLGACIQEFEDSLIIKGVKSLKGGEVQSCNDHRIAMALSVASCISSQDVILCNADVVAKSAPGFYNEFESLGGNVTKI